MRGFAWVLGLLAGSGLGFVPRAEACRCQPVSEMRAAYGQAGAVVRARVVALKPVPARRGARAKLRVSGAWKQHLPAELSIATLDLCAYPLKQGEEYVLFLLKDQRDWVTTRCMGNLPVSRAQEALHWLEQNGERR